MQCRVTSVKPLCIPVAMKFAQLANFKKAITRTILKVWETLNSIKE